MESSDNGPRPQSKIGDRSTSDVVVRIRTQDGRDDWIYCHSHILINKSKYFADRLSDNWPTCQILDSRNCVEVHCEECDFDYHVTVLRLFYLTSEMSPSNLCNVKNALSTLRVAFELDCPEIISVCVSYLEAVPWEESEEEEILKIIPQMGSRAEKILARLQPVNCSATAKIFLSAVRFATSSPPSSMNDLKTSAQEQLEYMITEDDDVPLLTPDDEIKTAVKESVSTLVARFVNLVKTFFDNFQESVAQIEKIELFTVYLTDISWVFQIVTKLEISRDLVYAWVEISPCIMKITEQACRENELTGIKLKVLEVTAKVFEAIGGGNVILPAIKRLYMVKTWLPYVRSMKSLIDTLAMDDENEVVLKFDGEIWQSLESSFVSLILTLPSGDQGEFLREWLGNEQIQYPDLTEAFEVWCYRSKVAKQRLAGIATGWEQSDDK